MTDPLDMLPEAVANDIRAIRSMGAMQEQAIRDHDTKQAQDLGNRISQAMGRLADWEDANPELARRAAQAAALPTSP